MISWIGELFRLRSEVEKKGVKAKLSILDEGLVVKVSDGKLMSKPEVFVLERENSPSKENKEKYDKLISYLRNLKRT